jgi:hypothetical protein
LNAEPDTGGGPPVEEESVRELQRSAHRVAVHVRQGQAGLDADAGTLGGQGRGRERGHGRNHEGETTGRSVNGSLQAGQMRRVGTSHGERFDEMPTQDYP